MRNRMYGGVRGRKTKVGEKLLRFPPTRLFSTLTNFLILVYIFRLFQGSGGGLGRRAVGGRFGDKGELFSL